MTHVLESFDEFLQHRDCLLLEFAREEFARSIILFFKRHTISTLRLS